jgi:hypothetical protein
MIKSLSVSLLLKDATLAPEISTIFRKIGVIPSFYDSLEKFWFDSLGSMPSLAIIDVRLMSDGKLALRNHPHVVTEKLSMSFCYDKRSLPLMASAQELLNCGLLNCNQEIEPQLKMVLKRVVKINELQNEERSLRKELQQFERTQAALIEENNKQFVKNELSELPSQLLEQVHAFMTDRSFEDALAIVLDNWEDVEDYVLLGLGQNKRKVISYARDGSKSKVLPDLFCSKTCLDGIDRDTQNMLFQVVQDVLGDNSKVVPVFGSLKNPELMLYMKVQENVRVGLHWMAFQQMLSGQYSQRIAQTHLVGDNEKLILDSWSVFDILQANFEGKTAIKSAIIDVDLTSLSAISLNGPENSFSWGKFFKDFVSGIARSSALEFKVGANFIEHIHFIVREDDQSEFFDFLKSYVDRFNFWNYFSAPEEVIHLPIQTPVQTIPMSPKVFWRYITDGEIVYSENSIQKNISGLKRRQATIDAQFEERELPYHEV